MTHKEVVERFCRLCASVRRRAYNDEIPADCFCGQRSKVDFEFDEKIMAYIEHAVFHRIRTRTK